MAKYKSQKVGEIHRVSREKSNIGDILGGIAVAGVVLLLMAACVG